MLPTERPFFASFRDILVCCLLFGRRSIDIPPHKTRVKTHSYKPATLLHCHIPPADELVDIKINFFSLCLLSDVLTEFHYKITYQTDTLLCLQTFLFPTNYLAHDFSPTRILLPSRGWLLSGYEEIPPHFLDVLSVKVGDSFQFAFSS